MRARWIQAYGLACALLVCAPAAGVAEDSQAGDSQAEDSRPAVGAISGSDVNVRAGPSVDFHDLGRLQRGDLVEILARSGDWCRVRVPGGLPVYVHGRLVAWEQGALRGRVRADDVLMRATPSQAYAALHAQLLRRDEEVVVLGAVSADGDADGDTDGGTWLRVLPPVRVHVWVHGRYVERRPPSAEHAGALLRAAEARRDALTGGRTKKEREAARRLAAERSAAELARLDRVLAGGVVGPGDVLAAQEAIAAAPTADLRRRATRLHEALLRHVDEQARAAARAKAPPGRARPPDRGPPAAVGAVGLAPEGVVLVVKKRISFRLRSRRVDLRDFHGERVRIWGRRTEGVDGRLPTLDVDAIEVVPSAK